MADDNQWGDYIIEETGEEFNPAGSENGNIEEPCVAVSPEVVSGTETDGGALNIESGVSTILDHPLILSNAIDHPLINNALETYALDGSLESGPVGVEGAVTEGIRGFIKVFHPDVGWGFIKGNRQTKNLDVFLHKHQFDGARPAAQITEADSPDDRHIVTFAIDWTDAKKPKAINVKLEQSTKDSSNLVVDTTYKLGHCRVCISCSSTMAWLHSRCSVCSNWFVAKGKDVGGKSAIGNTFGKGANNNITIRSGPYDLNTIKKGKGKGGFGSAPISQYPSKQSIST